jgi:ParB/RepB/Spo0J family partition protein
MRGEKIMPSTQNAVNNHEYRSVPVTALAESATNPRKRFDAKSLEELAASFKTQGILAPLLVRELEESKYEVVAGARRLRAAKLAELEKLPVRVVKLTDAEAIEAQCVENLQREDIHPLEEALGFKSLLELGEPVCTIGTIASRAGKSEAYVYGRVRLAAWKSVKLGTKDLSVSEDRIIRPRVYEKIMKAVGQTPMSPENRVRVKACMRLQRESGLAIVGAVTLHKSALIKEASRYRIRTQRQKTNTNVNVPVTEDLGRALVAVKNGNPEYFFWSGSTLPEDAPSYFQKLYRKVFKLAGVHHSSHDLRHTYAATFLEAGGDIRLLSKALGHSSVTITEKFYAHFTKKQQEMLDQAAERALAAISSD